MLHHANGTTKFCLYLLLNDHSILILVTNKEREIVTNSRQ